MITEERRKYLENYRKRPGYKAQHADAQRRYMRKKRASLPPRPKKEKNPFSSREFARNRRLKVLNHYGNGNPACNCCGESHVQFLALDHKHGGGNQHRNSIVKGPICAWIVKNNFPPIFQILCHNCNQSKGYYGSCPHQKDLGSQSD